MDDLNQESIAKFGRSLRVALQPTIKRMIGREANYAAFSADDFGTKQVLHLDVCIASEE